MIKQVLRLTRPRVFLPAFVFEEWPLDAAIVRPTYLSICAADQRYFKGDRPSKILQVKLPMALLHEAVGEVLDDPTGKLRKGDKVVMVPCVANTQTNTIRSNYSEGGLFHSSTCDGFAQEFLTLPHNQLIKLDSQDEKIYVFAELVSVCAHAVKRWLAQSSQAPKSIGVWGDGAFSFILTLVLKALSPETKVAVFGKHDNKLSFFSFADKVINIASASKYRVEHAFECVGGAGAAVAIDDIIDRIYPQGSIFLLGVSEAKPSINTRMILEKGLTVVGCSRSSYEDFKTAVEIIKRPECRNSLYKIIENETLIANTSDLEQAFIIDQNTAFKTILKWAL